MSRNTQPSQGGEIAIDLGTYNSVAAIQWSAETLLMQSNEGQTDQGNCFPSFVEFDDEGEVAHVGELARRALNARPEYVVWGAKRLIGKSYEQAKKSGELQRFQYKVIEGKDGGCRIVVGKQKKEYTPTDIAAIILRKIKQDCESEINPINAEIASATITVPAYFSPLQKFETEQAARQAGFETVYLIPEPTAAALAYQLKLPQGDQFLLVVDIGAGTFDVTAALAFMDPSEILQTAEKGHGGDTALGGVDIDDALLAAVIRSHDLKSVARDANSLAKLRFALEKAKIALSKEVETKVAFATPKSAVEFVLTREQLEAAVTPVLLRCLPPIDVALLEAEISIRELDCLILVGGPSYMPIYRRMLLEKFRQNHAITMQLLELDRTGFPVSPMEAVARGAVLGQFGGITPHAYGVIIDDHYSELIPRRTRYPCTNTTMRNIANKKRSLTLQLVQRQRDMETLKEMYLLLGIFQFDYQPDPRRNVIHVESSYSENGVLDLKVTHTASMVEMHLYNVGRLEGRQIARPRSPLPTGTPVYVPSATGRSSPPPGRRAQRGTPGGTLPDANDRTLPGPRDGTLPAAMDGEPPSPPEEAPSWKQKDLDEALRLAYAVETIGKNRMGSLSPTDATRATQLLSALARWTSDSLAPLDTRVPQVRNDARALLALLSGARCISPDEMFEINKLLK